MKCLAVVGGLTIVALGAYATLQLFPENRPVIRTAVAAEAKQRVHIKTKSLDQLTPNRRFPASAEIAIDGIRVLPGGHPQFFDGWVLLGTGRHLVTLKLMDTSGKLTEKKYTLNVDARGV